MQHHPRHLVAAGCLLIVTALVVLLAASQADAQRPLGAPHQPQSGAGTAEKQVTLLWKKQVGHNTLAAPYFDSASNQLYVNSGGSIIGAGNFSILDVKTGGVVKSVETNSFGGDSDVVPVAGTMVCTNQAVSTVCRRKTSLATVWKFDAKGKFKTSPLYVPSKNAVYVANNATRRMYKLTATTGKLQASVQLPGSWFLFSRPSFAMKHDLVVVGDGGLVAAVNADTLNLVWKYATATEVLTAGVLSEDESIIYYGTSYGVKLRTYVRGSLYALSTGSGKLVWKFTAYTGFTNSFYIAPSLHNGILYAASGATDLYALNAMTGKQVWNLTTAPGIQTGYSYIYDDTVLFPYNQGVLAVALNGSGVAWKWAGSYNVFNFPAPTADGKLFSTDFFANVYALQLPVSNKKGVVESRNN